MNRGFQPAPLAESLTTGPFDVGSARRAGVSKARLRAADLDASIHGVRAAAGSSADFRMRCRMFAARLPAATFFSHATAAMLYGIPLPTHAQRISRLHVTVPAPARAPHAAGLIGHSRFVAPTDVATTTDGIAVSSPARTFLELASVLTLPDLVAAADHLIRHDAPLCTLTEIAERLSVGDRLTRPRMLWSALELANPRSESRRESLLRLIVLRCGWGPPEANWEVRGADGRRMRIDLAFPELKLAIEYQGDYHRDRAQWRKDLTRRSRLQALGWTVVEVTVDDLADADELVARIQAIAARSHR